MAGVFIGQMLYRSRASRHRRSEMRAWSSDSELSGKVGAREADVAVTGRRR